ncbi:GTPase-associated system all-helical protein GASH [Galbibacter sp.]|uniref:GTPase-associated system all-helical protein GASH n=1 Tax=Galbibacter sp. TaxID=2918471 RepID=UPI003A8DA334
MSETILQTYLDNQFIKTADSGNIDSLKKAVTEVVKRLNKKKEKIIPFTLVAIDPFISENDPVVSEVERIIISKWPAFKNSVTATNDKSITYIRAVILQALSQIAKDEKSAAIIWLSARNSIRYYKLSNQENTVLSGFLLELGNKIEISAQKSWSSIIDVKLPDFSLPERKVTSKILNSDNLVQRLRAAAGASTVDNDGVNRSLEDSNRYWPNSNQNWTSDFGKIAGKAIASAINNVLTHQTKSIEEIQRSINENMQLIAAYIENIGSEVSSGIAASNLRSKLLWWKESLFSNSIKTSYRELSPVSAAIIMAIDLAKMVNPIYPISVDYLLKETLKGLYPDEVDKEVDLDKFIKESKQIPNAFMWLLTKLNNDTDKRKQLLVGISNNVSNDSYDIYSETGLSKDNKINLGDFAVWLLHDLQAIKIANAK